MEDQSTVMQPKLTFRARLLAGAKAFSIILGCGTVAGAGIPILHFANFSTDAIWFGAGVGALLTFPPALYAFQCQWNAATQNKQDRDNGIGHEATAERPQSAAVTPMQTLMEHNRALSLFVGVVGFDPDKVIAELSSRENDMCKSHALLALSVHRDFSNCVFSPAGVEAANSWLDSMMRQPATPKMADNKSLTTTST